jgi:hypothetical protein
MSHAARKKPHPVDPAGAGPRPSAMHPRGTTRPSRAGWLAAQSVWDSSRGRSVARKAVLGPAAPPSVADLGVTRTVGTRAVEFQEELAGVVSELVERFDRLPEDLSKNEKFLDSVARASVTAMRDHRPDKREMLRNELLNSALPSSFDEDIQQILFRFIDELEARGLLPQSRTNPTGASPLAHYAHLTPMCKRLLEFIAKPPDTKKG